jgi:hypothetical protein
VGVLDTYCPHRNANLFWGRNEEEGLRCVYHGWKFDIDGACIDMPSEPPASRYNEKVRQTAYQAVDKGGVIWVYMGPRELTPELPQLEWTLPDSPQSHEAIQRCNFLQNLEGELIRRTFLLHSTALPSLRIPAPTRTRCSTSGRWITASDQRAPHAPDGRYTGASRPICCRPTRSFRPTPVSCRPSPAPYQSTTST